MHALLLITLLSAQTALQDFDRVCHADNGKLWGRSLCGPIVLADPVTRDAVASLGGRVFEAKIPESIGIANTAVTWEGRQWTMVVWPLPDDVLLRRALLAHESFHRIQKDLGFPSTGPSNAHLDSSDARYWMRLEWRALARALGNRRDARRAIEDALAFRAARRALTPNAAEDERLLEMHEGLAEYTGFAIAEPRLQKRSRALIDHLKDAEGRSSYVRSFAYASGPAWGALIEMRNPRWVRSLKSSNDLDDLAARAWNAKVSTAPRFALYEGDAIRSEENARAEKKRQLIAVLRAKFVDGPVLIIPLEKFSFVMDPNGLQPLDDIGTVYNKLEVTDKWGKLVAPNGAMMSADFKRVIVPLDSGYTLTLNEGWRVIDGTRAGDKTIMSRP